MDTNQLKSVGASLAARHARNKVKSERDEGRDEIQFWAAIASGMAIVVAALMMAF